jgi:site-specific DNA-cytosine methylase
MTYIYPIDDGREVEKHQNGTGIGNEGDPAYTLDRQQQPAVAIGFSHTQGIDAQPTEEGTPTLRANGSGMAVAFQLSGDRDNPSVSVSDTAYCLPANPMSDRGQAVAQVFEPKSAFEENWSESDVKNALRAEASKSSHAVVQAFDSYNHSLSETNQTLRKGVGGIDHTGSVLENSTVRRLTPTECERLQGFPDGWTDGQADSHRYKQMGNAVAVPVVQWIIDRMTK